MTLPTDAVPPTTEFKDRKSGLVLFGVLTVLLGGLCALFIPLMFFGQAMSAKAGNPQNTQAIVPAIMMYGVLAVALVWLGIGSMMARRWARALLLVFSWSWLIMGIISIGAMAFILPKIMASVGATNAPGQPELPAAAKSLMIVIPMLVMGVIYVVLPIAWVLFYRSSHVKATCEACDPIVRWTDRCPLPVIAASLWLSFSALMMLMMAVVWKGVLPVFGSFLVGPSGVALCVFLALLWGYCAWAMYKLDRRGWWIVVASIALFSFSAFMTYSRHDLMEVYALIGYSEQQIAELQKFNFFQGTKLALASVCGAVPILGYMVYLRRFFVRSEKNPGGLELH